MRPRNRILFSVLLSTLFVLCFAADTRSQTRVDNPARPLSKNAGRVVNLEEVLRIRDDGANMIFRAPRDLCLGPEGSLYFTDYTGSPALYRFGPKGGLVFKILKKGQGPGEIQSAQGYLVSPEQIRVLSWNPPKIMSFSPDGRYLREARVAEDTHGLWFLGQVQGRIYGIRDELFSSKTFNTSRSSPVFSVPNSVYEISPDFKIWRKLCEFPVRTVLRRGGGFRLDPIGAVISGTTLYILHTAEYQVTAFDLPAGRIKHILRRAYDRVRTKSQMPAQAGEDPEMRGIDLPDDSFAWDISRIQAAAGKLFVFTSTFRGGADDQQVDVFDSEGKFIDSIALRFPPGDLNHQAVSRWTILTDEGIFIIPEQDPDGLVSIGHYRIKDPALFPSPTSQRRIP